MSRPTAIYDRSTGVCCGPMSDAGLRNGKWRLSRVRRLAGQRLPAPARFLVLVRIGRAPRCGGQPVRCAGASPCASSPGSLGGRDMEGEADRTAPPSRRRRKGGRAGPVRGPRPLGIEVPGARPDPVERVEARGASTLGSACGRSRTRSLPMRGSERKAPDQGARWRRRGPGGSAAPEASPQKKLQLVWARSTRHRACSTSSAAVASALTTSAVA